MQDNIDTNENEPLLKCFHFCSFFKLKIEDTKKLTLFTEKRLNKSTSCNILLKLNYIYIQCTDIAFL